MYWTIISQVYVSERTRRRGFFFIAENKGGVPERCLFPAQGRGAGYHFNGAPRVLRLQNAARALCCAAHGHDNSNKKSKTFYTTSV
jgi:hypothetical protein